MFLSGNWLTAVRLIAVCMLLWADVCEGAAPGFTIKSWSVEAGLVNPHINALLQTDDGYLWIATRAGLGRFDGTRLKLFSRANTEVFAGGDGLLSLAQDKLDGSLWVGTSRGVVRLKNRKFQLFTAEDGLDGGYPPALSPSREGGVWVETGHGASRIAADGKIIRWAERMPAYELPVEHVGGLLEDRDGKLWQANNRGVYRADLATKTNEAIALLGSPGGRLPRDLIQTADGTIYWISGNSLARYRTNTLTLSRHTGSTELSGIALDWEGNIWVGGVGLFRFLEGKFLPVKPEVFREQFVQTLAFDKQGHLWVGTRNGGGVYRIKEQSCTVYTAEDGLLSTKTLVVRESRDGSTLIGTDKGLNRWANGTMEVLADGPRLIAAIQEKQEYVSTRSADIHQIFEQDNEVLQFYVGRQYLGGHSFRIANSRLEYDPGKFIPTLRDGEDTWQANAWFISRERNGQVTAWCSPRSIPDLSLHGGFEAFPMVTEWRTNEVTGGDYLGGFRSRSGAIWFGSWRSGLTVFRGEGISSFTTNNGLASNTAMAIQEQEDGSIWITTEKGLSRWKDGAFRNIGVEQGLNFGAIIAMLDDGLGFYWMGGHRAVFRVPKENLTAVADGKQERLAIQVIGPPAGGTRFPSAFKSKTGELWFASGIGALRFNPRKVPSQQEGRTLIEDITIDGKKVGDDALGGGLTVGVLQLPPDSGKIVRIDFTKCNFDEHNKVRFHHRLRGHSDNWVESEAGEAAQFIGLLPGKFEFEVAAESPRGGWGHGASFAFAIAPHFYETKPFYVLFSFGGLFMFGSIHWLRLRNSRRIYRLESENAINKERERIAADMHDVLGSSLTKIGLQTEIIKQRTASHDDTAVELQKLGQTVRNAVSELDQVIWIFQSRESSLCALVEHLHAYAEDFLEPSGPRLFVKTLADLPKFDVPTEARGEIVLIVREALNNVIKHARASNVWLTTDVQGGHLEIRVRDDGIGAQSESKGDGDGLVNMRTRVERLNGRLRVERSEVGGTQITACVPLRALGSRSV